MGYFDKGTTNQKQVVVVDSRKWIKKNLTIHLSILLIFNHALIDNHKIYFRYDFSDFKTVWTHNGDKFVNRCQITVKFA